MAEEQKQQKKPEKKFFRRDQLLEIEKKAQDIWEHEHTNQIDIDTTKKKFFMTFPYPYLNGKLHLGHIFSMTKCDFTCRFKRA